MIKSISKESIPAISLHSYGSQISALNRVLNDTVGIERKSKNTRTPINKIRAAFPVQNSFGISKIAGSNNMVEPPISYWGKDLSISDIANWHSTVYPHPFDYYNTEGDK